MQINLEYEIGQEVYTIIRNGNILQTHKTTIWKIVIYGQQCIKYELTDNLKFGGLYQRLCRENNKILIFKTETEAKKYLEKIGGQRYAKTSK